MARSNTTKRSAILSALAEKFKEIDGSGNYKARLDGNVETRMKFWDEIEQYPAVHMAGGSETRQYYGGGQKWRFLTITIRAYVNAEDPIEELEELFLNLITLDLDGFPSFHKANGDFKLTWGKGEKHYHLVVHIESFVLEKLLKGEMSWNMAIGSFMFFERYPDQFVPTH